MVMLFALPMYSKKPEYLSVGKQFNTVVVNVPASFIIKQASGHSVKIINESGEYFIYEIKNVFIVSTYFWPWQECPDILIQRLL